MKTSDMRRPLSLRGSQAGAASLVAIGASMTLLANGALAQQTTPAQNAAQRGEIALDTLRVEDSTIDTNPYAQPGAPYQARVSGDERHVKPLAETPQTIQVITQTELKDSGITDLRDIVAAQPGITVGTGENGNAFGDRYIIRGQEARSDVFIDGLRDAGMTMRESFAVEQIEISKGPNSTFAGRGAAGGAINSITKKASTDYTFNKLELGAGTDKFRRVELDSNLPIGDTFAVRANLLHNYEEVPDRDGADRERNGAALSASFDITPQWNVIGDYYYLSAQDMPDMGTYIPSLGVPIVDPPSYYQNNDFLKTQVDVYTLRSQYNFNAGLRLSNAARYGTTENGYVITGGRTTLRGPNDPARGIASWTPSAHNGWQEVEYFVDNLNLYTDFMTGSWGHEAVFGAEYSDLKVLNGIYTVTNTAAANCITGNATVRNNYCLTDPTGVAYPNVHALLGRTYTRGTFDSDYRIETVSVYGMDTIDITDKFQVFAGGRWDSFDYSNNVGTTTRTLFAYADDFWSGHGGVVYKPNDNATFYFTYSSANEINGGESDVGGSCGYGGICNGTLIGLSKPERSDNFEIGAKLQFFQDKLLFTAAAFDTTKKHVMEGADYTTFGTLNTGENKVTGVELSLVGNVTDKLSTQIAVSSMESEITKSFNAANVGLALSNFADNSAYAQVRYELTDKLAIGGVARYQGQKATGQPDSAAGYNAAARRYTFVVPAYTIYDLFASYDLTEKAALRLNVGNVADREYYTASYRAGFFTYLGDKRNAQLTLSYAF
jgi:catecholate siderophore receptor